MKIFNLLRIALLIIAIGITGQKISFRSLERKGISRYSWSRSINFLEKIKIVKKEKNEYKLRGV